MKILVLCLPGIGDALMATPMVKVLKEQIPESHIDVACMFSSVAYLFKNNDCVDNVFFLNMYKKRKIAGARQALPLVLKRYDISILTFPAYRREYHWVQWFIQAKKRIAHKFKKGYWSEFNFLDTNLIPVDENEHHVINNLNLLNALEIYWEDKYKKEQFKYDFKLDDEDVRFGKDYIKSLGWDKKLIVGIHPGSIDSRVGVLKRWPIENFASLAKKLIERNKKILIFIGPDEADLGLQLEEIIGDKKNCKLIDNLKFNQSVGLLSQIGLLISNDNGFAHLANALRIKSIILFGPTNVKWCAPYDKTISKTIRKADFEPWFRNDIKVTDPPKGAKSGMEAISVDSVLSLLR